MRLAIALVAFGLAIPAAAGVPPYTGGSASSPVSTQPLAPGEVLLELGGIGTATTHAGLATVTLNVQVSAPTQEQANRDEAAASRRLVAALRRAGVAADDIHVSPISAMRTFDVLEEPPPPPEEGPAGEPVETPAPPPPSFDAGSTFTVQIRDATRVQAVLEAARQSGAPDHTVAYALTDAQKTSAATRAQAQALAATRADAEAYAAALGMRVVRIVRVTERGGMDMMAIAMSEGPALRRTFDPSDTSDPDIDTAVLVGVDFALAPR